MKFASKSKHVRLINDSKLTVGVSMGVVSEWPCDGVPYLLPNDSLDRHQPRDPE